MSELLVAINQDLVGAVTQGANARLHFTYEEGWRDRDDSYPLSLSMPLGEREYGDGVIRPFLDPHSADRAGNFFYRGIWLPQVATTACAGPPSRCATCGGACAAYWS